MNARIEALKKIGKRTTRPLPESTQIKHSLGFCARVFHRGLIQQLPEDVAKNWLDTIDGKSKI